MRIGIAAVVNNQRRSDEAVAVVEVVVAVDNVAAEARQ